jgi:hypothetical protein
MCVATTASVFVPTSWPSWRATTIWAGPKNPDGSYDLIADLWGVAKKHNQTELINSINQKYAAAVVGVVVCACADRFGVGVCVRLHGSACAGVLCAP